MIKALIFDFDGLILDTEVPEYQSWVALYQAYGSTLPLAKWAEGIGSADGFNPYEYLEQQLGQPVDRAAVRLQRRARFAELMADQTILPGVEDYIITAKKLGLKLGVASSSSRAWVSGHLSNFGLLHHFDAIGCGDEVAATKPDPTLYLTVLQALEIQAHEAIALEDSPNGILAAKRAGIFCVAIPNALTRQLSLSLADLQLHSLTDLPLAQILQRAGQASEIEYENMNGKPERVYTTTDYYDGPRRGIADYLGVPHVYESLWNEAIDEHTDRFQLMPIDSATFALALEDWAIWRRWRSAFDAGTATLESHPALPADADRHAAIVHLLGDKLTIIADRAITVSGRFELQTASDVNGETHNQSIVYWSNVVNS